MPVMFAVRGITPLPSAVAFPSLSGLIARYMADTGVTTSGGNVTAVVNQANPGTYDLTNSGTVPFNATSAYNSKPAFDFVAANGAALTTASFGLTGSNAAMFVVGRMETATATDGAAISYGAVNDTAAGYGVFIARSGATAAIQSYTVDTGVMTGAMTTAANHRMGVNFEVTAPLKTLYVDNSSVNSAAVGGSFTTGGTLVIGNRFISSSPTGGAWQGPILEIVICTAAQSATELNNLDAYFTGKYGT